MGRLCLVSRLSSSRRQVQLFGNDRRVDRIFKIQRLADLTLLSPVASSLKLPANFLVALQTNSVRAPNGPEHACCEQSSKHSPTRPSARQLRNGTAESDSADETKHRSRLRLPARPSGFDNLLAACSMTADQVRTEPAGNQDALFEDTSKSLAGCGCRRSFSGCNRYPHSPGTNTMRGRPLPFHQAH